MTAGIPPFTGIGFTALATGGTDMIIPGIPAGQDGAAKDPSGPGGRVIQMFNRKSWPTAK